MPSARNVRISRQAEKALEAFGPRRRDQVRNAIRELSSNPLLGKKLKGELMGLRSLRLGPFRIVYRFEKDLLEVVYLEHRREVYR
jgi:mRNA-degrading endonuclease RelE of RelBE toxin-antitoxin system